PRNRDGGDGDTGRRGRGRCVRVPTVGDGLGMPLCVGKALLLARDSELILKAALLRLCLSALNLLFLPLLLRAPIPDALEKHARIVGTQVERYSNIPYRRARVQLRA